MLTLRGTVVHENVIHNDIKTELRKFVLSCNLEVQSVVFFFFFFGGGGGGIKD